jgi:hypothetical protein
MADFFLKLCKLLISLLVVILEKQFQMVDILAVCFVTPLPFDAAIVELLIDLHEHSIL